MGANDERPVERVEMSLTKLVDLDDMAAFEGVVWSRGRNVHNDPELAKEAGIAAPFASGMMQLAFIHELLEAIFERRWTNGGSISARWLGLVFAGDTIQVTATVREDPPPATWISTTGVVLDISCTNQSGARTAAATAYLAE